MSWLKIHIEYLKISKNKNKNPLYVSRDIITAAKGGGDTVNLKQWIGFSVFRDYFHTYYLSIEDVKQSFHKDF